MKDDWKTRQTLLQRARNVDDDQAWEEFVAYYKNFIIMVMHKMNLPVSQQEDLAQEILLKLWRNLKNYSSEKAGFRTWLSGVIRNSVLKFYEANGRRQAREDKGGLIILDNTSQADLDVLIYEEWRSYLTGMALDNIKKIFSGKAFEALEMTLEEVSVDEICRKLDLKKESLYVLRNRVKSRFIEELRYLSRELQF